MRTSYDIRVITASWARPFFTANRTSVGSKSPLTALRGDQAPRPANVLDGMTARDAQKPFRLMQLRYAA
jgi:hypothetical protein